MSLADGSAWDKDFGIWNKKKSALEVSNGIGFEFPKSSVENYIKYLEMENKLLKQGIQVFIDKNFKGGSKSDREDYAQMVSCKDIWDLRELIKG